MFGSTGARRRARVSASLCLALAAVACATQPADRAALERAADREAIEATLQRYMTGIDTMDEALYASPFTEDATFELNGQVYEGREAIGGIIRGVRENRETRVAEAEAAGTAPPPLLFHVMNNSRIRFGDDGTAHHSAYYMTITRSEDGVRIGAIGRYEDDLVKQDGEWLIVRRQLIPDSPG